MRLHICVFALTTSLNPSHADFQRWSSEVTDDPFTGGQSVTVGYLSSLRSGAYIFCDTAVPGVRIRAVPGFAYDDRLDGFEPTIAFAVDGQKFLSATGTTSAVGDNIAAAEVILTGTQAQLFVDTFAGANRQIAIQDGISDMPHLLSAAGSTVAGKSLTSCLSKQQGTSGAIAATNYWDGAKSVSSVVDRLNDVWRGIFSAESLSYSPPAVFAEGTPNNPSFRWSSLGYDEKTKTIVATGKFHGSQKADELDQIGAEILIAKIHARHVQGLTGITAKFREISAKGDQATTKILASRMSVQIACFAGIGLHFTSELKATPEQIIAVFERYDDDLDSPARDRVKWFEAGAKSGKVADCDTFNDRS